MEPAKWELVVAEAVRQFARHGFRKTSMDDIARGAGVAKGTLYLGCESKRDLFYQAILRDLRLWHAELARDLDPRAPADRLLASVTEHALATLDRFPLARDLIRDEYARDLPDWQDRLDDLRGEGTATVVAILRLGVGQGRFRSDLDIEAAAAVFLDLFTGAVMFHSRGAEPRERLAAHLAAGLDLVLFGLAPRAAGAGKAGEAATAAKAAKPGKAAMSPGAAGPSSSTTTTRKARAGRKAR